MRENPGTLQAGGAIFPTTHWSMIAAGGRSWETSPGVAEEALAELCGDYWAPIYWFIRRRGFNGHDAQDLTQGFFAYLIETKAYARADLERGKTARSALKSKPAHSPRRMTRKQSSSRFSCRALHG